MERRVVAVDQTAEEYWKSYFKEYGKQWVRKIPRRVAMAIAERLQKAASKEPKPRITKATIAPLGFAPTLTGGLTFEGIFRGATEKGHVYTAFSADFDGNGELTNLEQVAV